VTAAAARHFAGVAADYGVLRARWPLGALRAAEQQAVRALIRIAPGERVLDAGCGDGATLGWVRAQGGRAVGVDLVWDMARHAARGGAAVAVQDMEALGVRPVFDWALCIGALEFTAQPARALAGLATALRPGGRVGLLFPRRTPLGYLYAAYHRRHGVPIRLFSPAEMETLLGGVGLHRAGPWRHSVLSTVCVARPTPTGS
jgi:SAM-dependent methyltransferase